MNIVDFIRDCGVEALASSTIQVLFLDDNLGKDVVSCTPTERSEVWNVTFSDGVTKRYNEMWIEVTLQNPQK